MSSITAATKGERITNVEIKKYDGTLAIGASSYARDQYEVTVIVDDPRVALLDDLLQFAQPQENECPPREVTLQSVIDRLQAERDKRNDHKGEPRTLSHGFTLDADDADVIISVIRGIGDVGWKERDIVDKALTKTAW